MDSAVCSYCSWGHARHAQHNVLFTGLILDQASEEKKRLEEKQRAARKNRSKSEEDWKTRCVPFCVAVCEGQGYQTLNHRARVHSLRGKKRLRSYGYNVLTQSLQGRLVYLFSLSNILSISKGRVQSRVRFGHENTHGHIYE